MTGVFSMDLGTKIEILQAEKNLSNRQLASKLKVFPQNLSKMKRVKKPRFRTVHKLSRAFNVPVSHFLCD